MIRRGNGLTAAEYTPLADLSAGHADGVLTALRDAGVAAYVAPITAEARGPAGSGEQDEPGQRLYVDAAARGRAEQVLMERLPGPRDAAPDSAVADAVTIDSLEPVDADLPEADASGDALNGTVRDEDTIWQEIVAGYDAETTDPPSWPDRENIEDAGPRITAARIIRPAEPPLSRPDPEAEPGEEPSSGEGDDEHYIPPPPPPLPRTDATTKFAWIGLAGGPLYLLLSALLQWDGPGWATFAAVAAFVGGFVTLVLRMGDERKDDGPDDGAVV